MNCFRASWILLLLPAVLSGCAHQKSKIGPEPTGGDATVNPAQRQFPMSPESMDGRRILLIAIPEDAMDSAYFLAGTAKWTGAALQVRVGTDTMAAIARGSRAALMGFSSATLPRLILPRYYPRVAALATQVEACVVVTVPTAPRAGLVFIHPFFGLALGREGEVFLIQADPSGP
jgi:hypothetical protein